MGYTSYNTESRGKSRNPAGIHLDHDLFLPGPHCRTTLSHPLESETKLKNAKEIDTEFSPRNFNEMLALNLLLLFLTL